MKKNSIILTILLISMLVTACGTGQSVELGEEDQKRVADYSTDMISKHNQYSNSRLVDVETVKNEYQKQIDLEAKKKNFIAMERQASSEDGSQDQGGSENGEGEGQGEEEGIPVPEMSIAEAIDIPEFDLQYTGFETLVSYPDNTVSDDVVMGMTAAQGDTLLVVHFLVTNHEAQDMECDVLSAKPQFRLRVNGERKTLQQTILANDLSKYSSVIPAGDSADTVLICELAESEAQNIDTLSLIIRSAEGRPEYVLEE